MVAWLCPALRYCRPNILEVRKPASSGCRIIAWVHMIALRSCCTMT